MARTLITIGLCWIAFLWAAELRALDPPHDSINCTVCHRLHTSLGSPLLSDTVAEVVCRSCHQPGGPGRYMEIHGTQTTGDSTYGLWSLTCTDCHNPHRHNTPSFPHDFIRQQIWNPTLQQWFEVVFQDTIGPGSYADGDSIHNGICEVCHTQTAHHRWDGSDSTSHYNGQNCVICHEHLYGFKVPASECLTCHRSEQGSRRNVAQDFHYPDLTLGAHHPLVYCDTCDLSLKNYNQCLMCHQERGERDSVNHANGQVDFVWSPDIGVDIADSAEWRGTYPSWWCLDCHDDISPGSLGGQTARNRRVYYNLPSTHYHSPASASYSYCGNCHVGGPNAWSWFPDAANRWGANAHTGQVGNALYSLPSRPDSVVSSNREEAVCYDCHGGGMNSRQYEQSPPQWMENIKVAASGGPYGRFWRPRSRHFDDDATDQHVACRDCHDPHQTNRYQHTLLINPNSPDSIFPGWTGDGTTPDAFCQTCHNGIRATLPQHNVPIGSKNCIDCHLPHGSTLPFLQYLSDSELAGIQVDIPQETLRVNPGDTVVLTGTVTGLPIDRVLTPQWELRWLQGGSQGVVYHATDVPFSIPDPPSIPSYVPVNQVFSELFVPDTFTIHNLDVWVDITHPYAGDLVLQMEHVETGTVVTLATDNIWDWNAFQPRFYDVEAESSVSRFPVEDLAKFYGESIYGHWRLYVTDVWNGSAGTLNGWSLWVNHHLVGLLDSTGKFTALDTGKVWIEYVVHSGRIVPVHPTGYDWANLTEPVRKDSVLVIVGSPGPRGPAWGKAIEATPSIHPPTFSGEPKISRMGRVVCQKCHP